MASKMDKTEKLFSYGTLQNEAVQLATFGRLLTGILARLPGYKLSLLKIADLAVINTSGVTHHPIACYSGVPADMVEGTVYDVSSDELLRADHYEVSEYQRMAVTLDSGMIAWMYVAVDV